MPRHHQEFGREFVSSIVDRDRRRHRIPVLDIVIEPAGAKHGLLAEVHHTPSTEGHPGRLTSAEGDAAACRHNAIISSIEGNMQKPAGAGDQPPAWSVRSLYTCPR